MKANNHSFFIQTFNQLPSTNDYVKQHMESLPHKSVIVANEQTNGRGRFTRVWQSQIGDVMMTISWKGSSLPHWLLAPLAIVRTLKRYDVGASIKWPNDIIVNDRKICGILIESVYMGETHLGDAIGIGLNVLPKVDASCLMEEVKNQHLTITAQNIIQMLCEEYEKLTNNFVKQYKSEIKADELMKKCMSEFMHEYRECSYVIGKTVVHQEKQYIVKDITKDGLLKIMDASGKEQCIGSQEITLQNVYGKGG